MLCSSSQKNRSLFRTDYHILLLTLAGLVASTNFGAATALCARIETDFHNAVASVLPSLQKAVGLAAVSERTLAAVRADIKGREAHHSDHTEMREGRLQLFVKGIDGPSRAKSASRSLRCALLMPQLNHGPLYCCGKRT